MWLRVLVIAFVTFGFYQIGSAGVRLDYLISSTSKLPDKPGTSASYKATFEIDGDCFHIRREFGKPQPMESSDDNGITTYFGEDRSSSKPVNSLKPSSKWTWAPMASWNEEERISVDGNITASVVLGVPVQTYTVSHDYVTAMRLGYFMLNKRDIHHATYEISTTNLDVPISAIRVALSRGFGSPLALHPEVFKGFPLRIVGHIQSNREGDGEGDMQTEYRWEAMSMEPWSCLNNSSSDSTAEHTTTPTASN